LIRLLEAIVDRGRAWRRWRRPASASRPARLENWQILNLPDSAGNPQIRVSGEIFGDPRFAGGAFVTTSSVSDYRYYKQGIVVVTRSGTEYLLGRPHISETFAKSRLARFLDSRLGNGIAGAPASAATLVRRGDRTRLWRGRSPRPASSR